MTSYQAIRNYSDLKCMAVPQKYQQLQTFYKYYSGVALAPYLTVFIGGNHEASNYLAELPYGGWVAPNIYYLGYAGVVNFRGLRIGGLSGIYRGREFHKGHFECPPYTEDTKRTAYYVRSLDMFRLRQLRTPSQPAMDIFLSHDWPVRIHEHGDSEWLFRKKPFFRQEAETGTLGNVMAMSLLKDLKPKYWFSAHLHVKFPALVQHRAEAQNNDVDQQEGGLETRFLALDKCLPHRGFLQILDVEPSSLGVDGENSLQYDPEWLAVLRNTNHLWNTTNKAQYMPGPGMGNHERYDFHPTDQELVVVKEKLAGNLKIPENFQQTAPPHVGPETKKAKARASQSLFYRNPQTTEFCRKLEILNLNSVLLQQNPQGDAEASGILGGIYRGNLDDGTAAEKNPDEIDLESDVGEQEEDFRAASEFMIDQKDKEPFIPPPLKRKSEENDESSKDGDSTKG